jgi:RNA polymerase II subunit A C-terminal domain phosphatase SSU72
MKMKIAVVCSSNMNRSMEAHAVLAKKEFSVSSFGTGTQIKIPGKSKQSPNCYPFGKSVKSKNII